MLFAGFALELPTQREIFIRNILFAYGVNMTMLYFQFQDPNEEEAGEPRVGFIQLNSGSTSFNTTLNLTGPILLGLGIAAATLFYAYFNAFNG